MTSSWRWAGATRRWSPAATPSWPRRSLCGVRRAALILALVVAGCGSAQDPTASAPSRPTAAKRAHAAASANFDWPLFGLSPSRPNATSRSTGITAANVARLQRHTVSLPGIVDSSPVYLHGVTAGGARHDVFVMTTTYGKTLAVDAASGRILWVFTPNGIGDWEGSAQITNASPAATRRFVYAASPDGRVHKLRLSDGREAGGRWPVTVTRDATHEKLTSSFNLLRGRLLVTTGGYIGDAPSYQGHVVSIDANSGR